WSVIIPVVVTTVLFFVFAIGLAFRAQKSKPTTGVEGLVGEIGTADTSVHHTGTISVHGETWSAFSDQPIPAGSRVKVVGIQQMKLEVVPYSSSR
ncbi:MAG TPA: NfeD family protein, partial [bacterium]|nr:NfeD family protein [bacterium]